MSIDFKHPVFLHGNLAEFFHVFDLYIKLENCENQFNIINFGVYYLTNNVFWVVVILGSYEFRWA